MDSSGHPLEKPTGVAKLGGHPKILLVDDNENKLIALESIFADLDLELILARSGTEALRLLLAHDFAVILLDVHMPIMDGFETAALTRTRKNSQHTPIIFITAVSKSEMHAAHGYALGAVDYIFAPVIPDNLRAKVLALSDLYVKSRDVERRAAALRQEAEQRATHLETRLESLLNRLDVGVFSMALDGQLITANPAFLRIFGIPPGTDVRTLDRNQLYVSEENHAAVLGKLSSAGSLHDQQVQKHRIDGTMIWISISRSLETDSAGHESIDGLVEDITSRKVAETALIANGAELARSNAELSEFAYIASHDLQEPLRTVSMYASLVEEYCGPQLDVKGASYLHKITDGAKRMRTLISDILDYSKTGHECRATVVDCNGVLDRVRYALQSLIADTEAEITPASLPTIHGDAILVGQIFQNLISNAIKFRRPDTKPLITISSGRVGTFWKFSCADNGVGIPEASYERIFQVFHRLQGRDKHDGNGIGLAICRKAVQRMNGQIQVTSILGTGSTFVFTLPCVD